MRKALPVHIAVWGLAVLGLVGEVWLSPAPEEPDEPGVVLDTKGVWRCFVAWRRHLAQEEDGRLTRREKGLYTPLPPPDWTGPDFDDADWARWRGPLPGLYADSSLALLCLRGAFTVTDPRRAQDLVLSVSYMGGVAVYVNGREVARQHVAAAADPDTPATPYAPEVYVGGDGFLLRHIPEDLDAWADRFAMRRRRIEEVPIPASLLRRGRNVLAIEVHRAPTDDRYWTAPARRGTSGWDDLWAPIGLEDARLVLRRGSGVRPIDPRLLGFAVWAAPPSPAAYREDAPDGGAGPGAIQLAGARNGSFTGAVTAACAWGLSRPRAVASDLVGPGGGRLPSDLVSIRYLTPGNKPEVGAEARYGRRLTRLDVLDPGAPRRVRADAGASAAQPICVTVHVPRSAAPGTYGGRLTVRADGEKPVRVPVALTVHDWVLPDTTDFETHVDLIQSPDSVALAYGVPMWSKRHLELLGETFALLGQVGAKTLYLPLIRCTNLGNEHSMVRWRARPDGAYEHDFSPAEQYLDAALPHLGRIPVVCLYLWDPFRSVGTFRPQADPDEGPPVTAVDPTTGALTELRAPAWGTPEARTFWKPVLDGLRERLRARGVEQGMMLGLAGDYLPSAATAADLQALTPDAPWVMQTHLPRTKLHGRPIGYIAHRVHLYAVWDGASAGRPGWRNPRLEAVLPRASVKTRWFMLPSASPVQYRAAMEGIQIAGYRGFGRIGADFWPVVGEGDRRRSVVLRFPQSSWGRLNLTRTTHVMLAAGADGPLATARFEMLRVGIQECQARIFLERVLADKRKRAAIGPDLAKRCEAVLEERTGSIAPLCANADVGRLWYAATARERADRLYGACADVAAAVDGE